MFDFSDTADTFDFPPKYHYTPRSPRTAHDSPASRPSHPNMPPAVVLSALISSSAPEGPGLMEGTAPSGSSKPDALHMRHGRLIPISALTAPELDNLLNGDLAWIFPGFAKRADGHQAAQQLLAHRRAPRRLEVVHQTEAALANGRVDGDRAMHTARSRPAAGRCKSESRLSWLSTGRFRM